MVMKQSILKGEKIRCASQIALCPFLCLLLSLIGILSDSNFSFEIFHILIILFSPLIIVMTFLALVQLEWFHVYEDRIEVRGILGQKNVVYFKDVVFVEERKIPLTTRDYHTPFFIFHDRRNNARQSALWDSHLRPSPRCCNQSRRT